MERAIAYTALTYDDWVMADPQEDPSVSTDPTKLPRSDDDPSSTSDSLLDQPLTTEQQSEVDNEAADSSYQKGDPQKGESEADADDDDDEDEAS